MGTVSVAALRPAHGRPQLSSASAPDPNRSTHPDGRSFSAADHPVYAPIPPATNRCVACRLCRDGSDAKTFWVDRVMRRRRGTRGLVYTTPHFSEEAIT